MRVLVIECFTGINLYCKYSHKGREKKNDFDAMQTVKGSKRSLLVQHERIMSLIEHCDNPSRNCDPAFDTTPERKSITASSLEDACTTAVNTAVPPPFAPVTCEDFEFLMLPLPEDQKPPGHFPPVEMDNHL